MAIQLSVEELGKAPNFNGIVEVEIPTKDDKNLVDVYSDKCTYHKFLEDFVDYTRKNKSGEFGKYYYVSKISFWSDESKYPVHIAVKCKIRQNLKNGLVVTPGSYLIFKCNIDSKANLKYQKYR